MSPPYRPRSLVTSTRIGRMALIARFGFRASDFLRHSSLVIRHFGSRMPPPDADRLLIDRIRTGDQDAWAECIARFEGRLLAFVDSRLRDRATSEDVVQDTFLGFLVGLPNYDDETPPETFLFSIAAHKLTDVLRRRGRRPTLPLVIGDSRGGNPEPAGSGRMASSLARSRERRGTEEQVLRDALQKLIVEWLEH